MGYTHIVKMAYSCWTLCDPKDYTAHGTVQARILEWVGFPFSRGSSQPRPPASQVDSFISWATSEAQEYWRGWPIPSPVDLPNPGIKAGSPALQVDSLPTELSGKSPYLQDRVTDVKNNFMVTKGERRGGIIERLELTYTH